MYEYLKNEDKELISKVSGYEFDDLITSINSLSKNEQSKIFSTEQMILTPLNKKGLQLLRIVLSDRINNARQNLRKSKYDEEMLELWRNNGCIISNEIFSSADVKDGYLIANDKFINLMQMTLGDCSVKFDKIEIQNLLANRGDDLNCQSHFDTYHTAVKSWTYLTDITIEHAPFHISPGTHINNEKRLRFMYNLSINMTPSLYATPGRYIDREHIFDEPAPILGDKYTTIIANVSAFHKRGNGKEGFSRKSAYAKILRKNPFRPIEEN